MQQCANKDQEARQLSRQLADTQRRVISMERLLGPFALMVGVDQTSESSIVPVISITPIPVSDNQAYVLKWFSQPGEFYQVQGSTNAIAWANLDAPIPATAAPATETSWTSSAYGIDDGPQYWRIRRFPKVVGAC